MSNKFKNENEIVRALRLLKAENDLIEIRCLNGKRTWSMYSKDPENIVKELKTVPPLGTQIYFVLNRIDDVHYHKIQREKFVMNVPTTSDRDITRRLFLPVDCDPVRPSGISSTDEELGYAEQVAQKIMVYLRGMGFPEPVYAMSGNGYHCLYCIDLDITEETKNLIKKCLEVLNAMCGNEYCHVDTVNYNEARIFKLYGTLAQKGADTPERPHRMARIISEGSKDIVPLELLKKLADELPDVPKPEKKTSAKKTKVFGTFNLESWLDEHGLTYDRLPYSSQWGDIYKLHSCPFCGSQDNAAKCYRLPDGKLGFGCHHNRCDGIEWQDFREKIEPGYRDKRKSYTKQTKTKNVAPDLAQDEDNAEESEDTIALTYINNRGQEVLLQYGVAEYIKSNNRFVFIGDVPYVYENGAFRQDIRGTSIKDSILKVIPQDAFKTAANTEAVYKLLQMDVTLSRNPDEMNQYPEHWVCFKNGMYDPIKKVILDHDEKYLCMNQIPHNFFPDQKPEGTEIDTFLSFAIPEPSDRELLLQYCGYAMTRDTRQQLMLILDGKGGTGKSTVISLQNEVVGYENISAVPLEKLCSNRFSAYNIMGKLLNVCADLKTKSLEDVSIVKQAIGEDVIEGEAKGKQSVFFKSYAKMMFSINGLPQVLDDKSNAFYRRLRIIRMNQVPKRIDHDLQAKLIAEIDHWIHICMDALARMYESGRMIDPEGSKEAVVEMQHASDTVTAFLMDACILDINDKCRLIEEFKTSSGLPAPGIEGTPMPKLYNLYRSYCIIGERQALRKKAFFKQIREKGYIESKTKTERIFRDIVMKPCCNIDGHIYESGVSGCCKIGDGDTKEFQSYSYVSKPSCEKCLYAKCGVCKM